MRMRLFFSLCSLAFSPIASQAVSSSVAIDPNDLGEISRIVLVPSKSGKPPCAPSPFSSDSQDSSLTFRPGEVGVYSWHMCVWKSESVACEELLGIFYSKIEPSYNPSSGQIPCFTATNFENTLNGSMLFQWEMKDNPFQLGLWMPGISDYQLSVQGSGCSRFGEASVNITMEMPSVMFNATQSVCPTAKYSDVENRVGVFGKNPLYPQNDGCSLLYKITQPSYGARYGFLQIVYAGDIDLTSKNEGGSFRTQIMRVSRMIAPLVVDCASIVNAACQTIGNQTRVEANKEGDVLYTGGSLYTLTAPYFSPDSCDPRSASLYEVEEYRNFGTQFLNYLMIKVDPQPGKSSYWVPVRRAGWFSSYEVSCPKPPCGTGLGPNYNASGSTPWAVNHLDVINPYEELLAMAASSPSWNGSFQQSFRVVSKSSQSNGSWFFCPTSLDVHPSHSLVLNGVASLLLLFLAW